MVAMKQILGSVREIGSMSTSLMPSMLKDETGYDTEGNRSLETGWPEVANGLAKVLFGNILAIVAVVLFVWMLLSLADMNKMMKAASSKVEWRSIALYLGSAIFALTMLYSYVQIFVGQWRCMHAPERNWAKTFMFACMLCLISVPILSFIAGWTGGMEAVVSLRPNHRGKLIPISEYLQLASNFLNLVGSILFILFLRAVASCWDDKVTVWGANLYLVFTGAILAASLYIAFGGMELDFDNKELSRQLNRGNYKVLLNSAIILWLGLASLGSYLWYLWLLLSVRRTILRGVANQRSPLEAAW
jgi:hypothetical protein